MLRSKNVTPDMVWSRSDKLASVCQPVGLDLGGFGLGIGIFFTENHVRWSQPSDLAQSSLTGVSPEPNTFAQSKHSALPLVFSAQCTTELGFGVSTCQGHLGSCSTFQVLLKGVVVTSQLCGIEVGVQEVRKLWLISKYPLAG